MRLSGLFFSLLFCFDFFFAKNPLDPELNQFEASNTPKIHTICTQNQVNYRVF